MILSQTLTQEKAALKAGLDRKTSRKYLKSGMLPSALKQPRSWKTRKDIFENVWPDVEIKLKEFPRLQAKTLLNWLIEGQKLENLTFQDSHLRTLQRKIRLWKSEFGPDKEIIFSQVLLPGKQSQSDCTCMNELKITIKGEYFKHLLFHFMLPYSRWETVSICFTESFESLTLGFKKAIKELCGVLPDHRTDNLSAATHSFRNDVTGRKERDFNDAWVAFLSHYKVKPSRNNPGVSHENGSVEKSHDIFKTAVDQELMLRRSRDFHNIEEYEIFLREVLIKKNKGRQNKFIEEKKYLIDLPLSDWNSYKTISVKVTPFSTITVLGCIYSVPSRLISYDLNVDIHEERIELRYGTKFLESIPRCFNENKHAINYRHIVKHLLRKPGAFKSYQFKDALFPSVVFRRAYDALSSFDEHKSSKNYLELLHFTSLSIELDVAEALEIILSENEIPTKENVKKLLDMPRTNFPKVEVLQPILNHYDSLLDFNSRSNYV